MGDVSGVGIHSEFNDMLFFFIFCQKKRPPKRPVPRMCMQFLQVASMCAQDFPTSATTTDALTEEVACAATNSRGDKEAL